MLSSWEISTGNFSACVPLGQVHSCKIWKVEYLPWINSSDKKHFSDLRLWIYLPGYGPSGSASSYRMKVYISRIMVEGQINIDSNKIWLNSTIKGKTLKKKQSMLNTGIKVTFPLWRINKLLIWPVVTAPWMIITKWQCLHTI